MRKNCRRILFLMVFVIAFPLSSLSQTGLLPDLKVDEVGFAHYNPRLQGRVPPMKPVILTGENMPYGTKIYLVCAFSNAGGVGWRPSRRVRWKLGHYVNGALVGSQSFGRIASGRSEFSAIEYSLDNAGLNTYKCVVDYENRIVERSETNNRASKQFTVERHVSLGVAMHAQETNRWCWAASGQMIMEYFGHNVTQCTQANNRIGVSYCCSVSPADPSEATGCPKPQCAFEGWPEFSKYDFSFQRTSSTALTWDQLVNQIADLKKPVAFTWAWTGGGGHVMTAVGIHTVDGANWVEVNDPWAPCHGEQLTISYDEYVERAADHTHWDDFYDVTYIGGP